MIGSNLDTCRRGPPLIKLMGYEHREHAGGVGGAGNGKHTHAHCPRDPQGGWSLRQRSNPISTHVSVARPLIKLMGYEHRVYTVGRGGSRLWQTYTNTYKQCPRDTQDGWSLGQ